MEAPLNKRRKVGHQVDNEINNDTNLYIQISASSIFPFLDFGDLPALLFVCQWSHLHAKQEIKQRLECLSKDVYVSKLYAFAELLSIEQKHAIQVLKEAAQPTLRCYTNAKQITDICIPPLMKLMLLNNIARPNVEYAKTLYFFGYLDVDNTYNTAESHHPWNPSCIDSPSWVFFMKKWDGETYWINLDKLDDSYGRIVCISVDGGDVLERYESIGVFLDEYSGRKVCPPLPRVQKTFKYDWFDEQETGNNDKIGESPI